MRKAGVISLLISGWLIFAGPVQAQRRLTVPATVTPTASLSAALDATESAEAATPSATKLPENRDDITQTTGEVKGRLERYLDEQKLDPLGPTNFIRYAIRGAVSRGVPANTLVLVLLFPVIAALIAAARHLIGLRGFGIYIPAVLSIAFVATGVLPGMVLFGVILGLGTYGMPLIKKLRMQYLPRMALLLWLVSLGLLTTILTAAYVGVAELATVNIFPILILVLLAENFSEVQMGKSHREATELTVETLILALISALILSLDVVQRFALLNPELLILMVAAINIIVGKYVGLRLTEYLKFKKLLEN